MGHLGITLDITHSGEEALCCATRLFPFCVFRSILVTPCCVFEEHGECDRHLCVGRTLRTTPTLSLSLSAEAQEEESRNTRYKIGFVAASGSHQSEEHGR